MSVLELKSHKGLKYGPTGIIVWSVDDICDIICIGTEEGTGEGTKGSGENIGEGTGVGRGNGTRGINGDGVDIYL